MDEKWCLGCHLCEYYCAFANSGKRDMVTALKDAMLYPRIQVEGDNQSSLAVSCRHCEQPLCVKSCITGALSVQDGIIRLDRDKCVGCYTCILTCPYGAITLDAKRACRNANCARPGRTACRRACRAVPTGR